MKKATLLLVLAFFATTSIATDFWSNGFEDIANDWNFNSPVFVADGNVVYEGSSSLKAAFGSPFTGHDHSAYIQIIPSFDVTQGGTVGPNDLVFTLQVYNSNWVDCGGAYTQHVYRLRLQSPDISGGGSISYMDASCLIYPGGWAQVVFSLADIYHVPLDYPNPVDLTQVNTIYLDVRANPDDTYGEAEDLYVDSLVLTDDIPPMIWEFEDIAAEGWPPETHGYAVLVQGDANSGDEVYNGSGSLKIDWETYPPDGPSSGHDVGTAIDGISFNGSNRANRGVEVHVYSDDIQNEHLHQIIIRSHPSTAEKVARLTLPGDPAGAGWREYKTPLTEFVVDDVPNPGFEFDWANIDNIELWLVSGGPNEPNNVYVDDLSLGVYKLPFNIENMGSLGHSGSHVRGQWFPGVDYTGVSVDSNNVYDGNESIKFAFDDIAPTGFGVGFDFVLELPEGHHIDLTEGGTRDPNELAFRFNAWGNIYGFQNIEQIRFSSPNTSDELFIPLGVIDADGEWKEYVCPISRMRYDPEVMFDPNEVDITNIDVIKFKITFKAIVSNLYIDNLRISDDLSFPEQFEGTYQYADYADGQITVDGAVSDWAAVASDIVDMDTSQGGNLDVQYRFAWDETWLYILIEELSDATQWETSGPLKMNCHSGSDSFYERMSFWFDFDNDNDGMTGIGQFGIDWLPFYPFLSGSAAQTDWSGAWVNGVWGGYMNSWCEGEASVIDPNGVVYTSGTSPNRVIEVKVKWATLDSVLKDAHKPAGGLVANVGDGYTFGADPWVCDGIYQGAHQGGDMWDTSGRWPVNGIDSNSFDVVLTGKCDLTADKDGNCHIDFIDFSILASEWLTTYDMTDLQDLADQWLQTM